MFKYLGKNVRVSPKASIYNPQNISIGDNSRIDDFCVLSASKEIIIGCNVHISVHCSLIGAETIHIDDYSALSIQGTIMSSSDDYSGNWMFNPTVDQAYTNVHHAPVYVGKYVIIGAHCFLMPGSYLSDGCAIGAMSFVSGYVPKLQIFGGSPAKFIKSRNDRMFYLERGGLNDSCQKTVD